MNINICKKRYGKREILDIKDFAFEKTGVIGLLGVNGAGKTTLFRIMTDLVTGEYEGPFKTSFSYFSDDAIYFSGTLRNTLDIVSATYADFDMDLAKQILSELTLKLDTKIGELSRGQKVLFNIVLTISRDTDCYLLDEMYSNLDFETREQITDMFVKHVDTKHKLVIVSSHEIHDIERLCDYICILHNKKLSKCESTDLIIKEYKTIYRYFEQYITGGHYGV